MQKMEIPKRGDEPYFVNVDTIPVPAEWSAVGPDGYVLPKYEITSEKNEEGILVVTILGYDEDGKRSGIAFELAPNIPYAVACHSMRDCFRALFRHQIQKHLDTDAGE